jgi:hypothetical protein
MASATSNDDTAQVSPEDNIFAAGEGPILHTYQGNPTTTSEDNSVLIQEKDSSTVPANSDFSTNSTEETQSDDNPTLIAAKSHPDYTGVIIVAITEAAIGVSLLILRWRSKNRQM